MKQLKNNKDARLKLEKDMQTDIGKMLQKKSNSIDYTSKNLSKMIAAKKHEIIHGTNKEKGLKKIVDPTELYKKVK